MVRTAGVEKARLVVELGPGTGGTTRAMLTAMTADARLLAIEINPRLARAVRGHIPDPRLVVYPGSAEQIREALDSHGLGRPDVVVSGIPFSQLERAVALRILESVREALAPGGRFVAYQARDRVEVLGRRVFGAPSSQLEVRNVPPMRVYCFEKGSRR